MKRLVAIMMVVLLVLMTFVGCSSKKVSKAKEIDLSDLKENQIAMSMGDNEYKSVNLQNSYAEAVDSPVYGNDCEHFVAFSSIVKLERIIDTTESAWRELTGVNLDANYNKFYLSGWGKKYCEKKNLYVYKATTADNAEFYFALLKD